MAAILGVLSSGLLCGVMIGAIISLVQLLRRASKPHVAFLGRIPGTQRFSDRERHPDNELLPGVLLFRPESSLIYFNVEHICDSISQRVRAETTPPNLVIIDLSAAPYMDLQSAHALAGLADEITAATGGWPTCSPDLFQSLRYSAYDMNTVAFCFSKTVLSCL